MTIHRTPRKNSMVFKVVAAVKKRGAATIDDLMPDFPGVDRKTVHAALANARDARQLRVKAKGNVQSRTVSIWEVGVKRPEVKPHEPAPRPLPSVWCLASPPEWAEWPPAFQNGRTFNLLGPWNEEATNDNHRSAAV